MAIMNCCAACLLLTTTGRVLVQYELDATLPLQYPQLALLVASLVQFAKLPSFAEVALSNALTLVVRSDAVAQLSCVVVCTTSSATDGALCRKQQALDVAHLQSLVILTAFLRCFRDDVDALVTASRASSHAMAEQYTLSSALEGGGSRYRHDTNSNSSTTSCLDGDADDGTLCVFLAFQDAFIAPLIEDTSSIETVCTGVSDSVTRLSTSSSVEITQLFLLHADTGRVVYTRIAPPNVQQLRGRYNETSLSTQQLLKRVACALSASLSILQSSGSGSDSHVGSARTPASATTAVLRIPACQRDAATTAGTTTAGTTTAGTTTAGTMTAASNSLNIAIQMFDTGTFAAVAFFYGANDAFVGITSELVHSGDLERVLLADPRGKLLLALVHEATAVTAFELHVGAVGAPACVLEALAAVAAPWTKRFEPL